MPVGTSVSINMPIAPVVTAPMSVTPCVSVNTPSSVPAAAAAAMATVTKSADCDIIQVIEDGSIKMEGIHRKLVNIITHAGPGGILKFKTLRDTKH